MHPSDEQQIINLFQDGDRALIAADVTELQRIYAGDYIQYDESGRASNRADLIRNLTSGAIRFLSMTSTGRDVRLLREDIAIVHGSEKDEIERDGQRSTVRYVYSDVVMKHDGKWQIVASQLAELPKHDNPANPVLPVIPNKPRESGRQRDSNHGIEFMEVFAQLAPILAQFHTKICERKAPRP
jgi:ketosteroid isomerase-like protein